LSIHPVPVTVAGWVSNSSIATEHDVPDRGYRQGLRT
jgi:hypothetical protein